MKEANSAPSIFWHESEQGDQLTPPEGGTLQSC